MAGRSTHGSRAPRFLLVPSIAFLLAGATVSDGGTGPRLHTRPAPAAGDSSSSAPQPLIIPGDDVNVSQLPGNEAEVTIDVNPTDPQNLVVAGHAPGFQTMNTFYTLDGGSTWSRVSLGAAADDLLATSRFDPTVAFDDDGNVYVGYGANVTVGGNRRVTVVVCKSTDKGVSYAQCRYVNTNANIPDPADPTDPNDDLPGNDKWMLATGPDPNNAAQQNVYIAWTQNVAEGPVGVPPCAAADGPFCNVDQRIVISRSTDGGDNFSPPVIVADEAIAGMDHSLFADPAVGPNGEVYVSWHDFDDARILVDASFDGGVTFGTDDHVSNVGVTGLDAIIPPQPDRGAPVGPTLDVDRSGGPNDGRLYIAYMDVGPGGLPNTDIIVRYSDDDGATWSAGKTVNDDAGASSQFLPWLDVDQQDGRVVVVWYDPRQDPNNEKVRVFLAVSTTGAADFQPNIPVADGQSDQSAGNPARWTNNYLEYIGVAVLGCVAVPVWSDNSRNLADLDYFVDRVSICDDHYLCYGARDLIVPPQHPDPLNLTDQFHHGLYKPGHAQRFCTPADKNDEGITDPITHLKAYELQRVEAPAVRATVDVVNQFGSLTLRLRKTANVYVPSAKGLLSPPDPPDPSLPGYEHFTCYKVSTVGAPFPKNIIVEVENQFGAGKYVLRKPRRMCAPAAKKRPSLPVEPVRNPARHLVCYGVRRVIPIAPPPEVHVTNQFGTERLQLQREREFCVPSAKIVVGGSTTTTTPTTTSTTSTTLVSTLCCDVPPGALGNPVPVCFVATPDPILIDKCQLLGGVVSPGVCDPDLEQCVPSPPVPANDFCCECPVPAPPFPHPQVCFEGVVGHESKCQPPCVLVPSVTCGPASEQCGGSPSGAFLDATRDSWVGF
ncbi:MAG TPA: sialidase family protein [Candidatus Binatia bacterium]|nr:sialidase family protein [Candidatus Binatia bacterium]